MITMALIEQRGGFLYQHRPDIIPQGFVTDEEVVMWVAYYKHKAQRAASAGHG